MTPFAKLHCRAAASMGHRLSLLQMPLEHFRRFFSGRVPSMEEMLLCVERAVQQMTSIHVYENDLYTVQVFFKPPFTQLNIRRRDGQPCKDWQHFQRIKNEIAGPECEAVELFPAESRLVDCGNEYHLWVHSSPGFRFPLGYEQRCVLSASDKLAQHLTWASGSQQHEELQGHHVA